MYGCADRSTPARTLESLPVPPARAELPLFGVVGGHNVVSPRNGDVDEDGVHQDDENQAHGDEDGPER